MSVTFMSIYCKSEKTNIPTKELLKLIKRTKESVSPATIEIETTPGEAEVWIDGDFMSWAPCTFNISPGTHTIKCQIQPDRIAEREFTCTSGETLKFQIHLA
jgi:hypothetical protein